MERISKKLPDLSEQMQRSQGHWKTPARTMDRRHEQINIVVKHIEFKKNPNAPVKEKEAEDEDSMDQEIAF